MRSQRITGVLLIALTAAVICGCTFDYEEARIAEDLEEAVPETILEDFTQVRIYDGIPEYRVYGDKAETFSKRNETIIEGVLFQEFDSEGELVTEGSADRIVFNSETEDAELSGNLEFFNSSEEAGVNADYLTWKNADKLLTGNDDDYTSLVKKDGSTIRGKGFSADLASKNISFRSDISGTWVDEEEEDEESAGAEEKDE